MASAAVDWTWQLPAVVFPFLLLSATLLSRSSAEEGGFSLGKRVGLAIVPLIFSILVAIPLFSTVALESSQEEARAGDLNAALEKARSAHSINPSTAAPLLQEAGLLEALGEPEVAIDAAREAAEAEPDNWRNWLILALIEARSGKATLALEHYQEAKRLNPRSQIFTPTAPE
jgi:tetratricopeptide (TPR) repeat protein